MSSPKYPARRSRAASIFLLLVSLAATRCGDREPSTSPSSPATPGPSTAPLTRVKLVLNWVPEPEFGGIYAARENGDFAAAGLDVDISAGGEAVLKLVATGKAEFGVVSADEVIIARNQGIDVVAFFATYQTCPQGLMVRASRGIESIGGIFAQPGTVAMQPGLAYKDFLKKTYGFEKVKVVPYDYTVARFLVEPDLAQQCFVTSEPIAARRAGVEPKVFLVADAGYNPYTAVVIASGERLRTNQKQVAAMYEALARGWRRYLDAPEKTNGVMAALNKNMDSATFAEAAIVQRPLIETTETRAAGLGTMTADRWETLAKQLVELGIVAKAIPASECFVTASALR